MKPLTHLVSETRPPARGPVPEARWVARARSGDRDAFDRLAVEAMPVLLGTARRLLRDPHAAEEAVAEALYNAFRRLDAFRGDCRFGTWAHRILCRVVADRVKVEVRERRRRLGLLERYPRRSQVSPVERLAAKETQERLRAATERLPPTQRLVLLLVVWEGLTLRQTAETLGMHYRTVKSNLYHARRSLERVMGEEGVS